MSRIKVISGGQSGVDVAALRAAKQLGIATGGWMPKGWLTEDGPRPEYAELYGMEERLTPSYAHRTRANVKGSDVTLWYGLTGSRGYMATLNACSDYDKRMIHADYYGVNDAAYELEQIAGDWTTVVNCAGNRESGNPGIGAKAEAFWLELFAELLKRTN